MNSHELLPLLPFIAPETLTRTRLPTAEELEREEGPRTFLLRGQELAALKTRIQFRRSVSRCDLFYTALLPQPDHGFR